MFLHLPLIFVHVEKIRGVGGHHVQFLFVGVFLNILHLKFIQVPGPVQIHLVEPAQVGHRALQGTPGLLEQPLQGAPGGHIGAGPFAVLVLRTVGGQAQLLWLGIEVGAVDLLGEQHRHVDVGAEDLLGVPVTEPGLFRGLDLLDVLGQQIAGVGQLGIVLSQQHPKGLFVVFTAQAKDPIGLEGTGGGLIAGEDQQDIQELDILKPVIPVLLGQNVKEQVAHFVKVQVPVVEPGILDVLVGRPGGGDIAFLRTVGAFCDTDYFLWPGKIQLFLSDDLLAQFLLADALGEILGKFRVVGGVVFSPGHQGTFAQVGHKTGQRLPGGLFKGLEFGLTEPIQIGVLRRVLLRPAGVVGGHLEGNDIKGVFMVQPLLVTHHNGAPLLMSGHTLGQFGNGVGQRGLFRKPGTERQTRLVDKRLEEYTALFDVVDVLLFRDHDCEQILSPPFTKLLFSRCHAKAVNGGGLSFLPEPAHSRRARERWRSWPAPGGR